MLVRMAMRKLDAENFGMFNESLRYPKEMPKLKELNDFLLRKHQVLATLKLPQESFPVVEKKRSHTAVTNSGRSTKNSITNLNCGFRNITYIGARHSSISP